MYVTHRKNAKQTLLQSCQCRLHFPTNIPQQGHAMFSLPIFKWDNFNTQVGISTGSGIWVLVFQIFFFICLFFTISAVLIASPNLHRWLQPCAFKQPCHEGKTLTSDIRLSSKGVKNRVYAATDKRHSRGEGPERCPDFIQSIREKKHMLTYLQF